VDAAPQCHDPFRFGYHLRWQQGFACRDNLEVLVSDSVLQRRLTRADMVWSCSTEGPLPEELVKAFEDAYLSVKAPLPNYNHSPAWYKPEEHGY
jgi:hypothetical protein